MDLLSGVGNGPHPTQLDNPLRKTNAGPEGLAEFNAVADALVTATVNRSSVVVEISEAGRQQSGSTFPSPLKVQGESIKFNAKTVGGTGLDKHTKALGKPSSIVSLSNKGREASLNQTQTTQPENPAQNSTPLQKRALAAYGKNA